MPKRRIPWMVLLTLALTWGGSSLAQTDSAAPAITRLGRPVGEPSAARIGPQGGEVRSPDGALTVIVPPGALSVDTEVSVQMISNNAPLGVGGGYRLGPAGVEFAEPVTLTFAYDEGVLAGQPPEFLWFISQTASGTWRPQRSSVVDTEAKTVTVSVSHFSDWAVGRFIDLKLEPSESVVVPGESVNLAITGFLYDPDRDGDDALVPLDDALVALTEGRQLLDSTERYSGFQVRNWRLNAQDAPVDGTNGSLISLERRALYTAPGTAPNPNTVAVSVDLQATNRDDSRHQYTLVANITIHTAEYYLTLTGLDGDLLFVGGGRRAEGARERHAANAFVHGSQFLITGNSDVDGASIQFVAAGATPGTHALLPLGEGVPVTYAPKDHDYSESTYLYWNSYLGLMWIDGGHCVGDGHLYQSPFSVTIDRFEMNEDTGIEVVYGNYSGTLYSDVLAERLPGCVTPPNRSAAVSGTFKLPVDRLGGPADEGDDDEPLDYDDIELVPLTPPG